MKKVTVIGGGPAGMMAAVQAAANGAEVTLLERNNKLGKKLMITGKGRCNITNSADLNDFIQNTPGNGKFLYSAYHNFFNDDIVNFFEKLNVPVKTERGGRIFPQSDRAADVVEGFARKLYDSSVQVRLNTKAEKILIKDNTVSGIKTERGIIETDALILAAGGACYPLTGSDGSGIKMARLAGHTIVPLHPALVPLTSPDEWVKSLSGLSLRNIRLSIFTNGKKTDEMFGEMMFTHFGVTGPIILSLSRAVALALADGKKIYATINLKPALTPEKLDARLVRDFQKYARKQIKNAMIDLLPHRLIPIVLDLAYIDEEKNISEVSKKERAKLVEILQALPFDINGTRPMAEAIVTGGGVSVKEIDPKTMQSKLVRDLFFAGEVTDIDAYTGGFNLQAAFSMGYAAGTAAALSK